MKVDLYKQYTNAMGQILTLPKVTTQIFYYLNNELNTNSKYPEILYLLSIIALGFI